MTSIVPYLIVTLIGYAVVQYVYGFFIAPALRTSNRYKVFALRDEIRRIQFERTAKIDPSTLAAIERYLNTVLGLADHISISHIARMKRLLESNPTIRRRIDKEWKTLDDCENKDVRRIVSEMRRLTVRSFFINSAPAAFDVIPLLAIFATLKFSVDAAIALVKSFSSSSMDLQYLPDRELRQLKADHA